MVANKVLVFPRSIFGEAFSLLPWDSVQRQIEEIESSFSWVDRPEAERSHDLVQAIPCAVIRDFGGKCCVLRRIQSPRNDLSRKLSLIVGGHIDHSYDLASFQMAMSSSLNRELEEEVGIRTEKTPRPVGVIIDDSSVEASRHAAFIHEMIADQVSPNAPEEFMVRSKFSGKFMTASQLAEIRDDFDPWSRLLIEGHICAGDLSPRPRQRSLF